MRSKNEDFRSENTKKTAEKYLSINVGTLKAHLGICKYTCGWGKGELGGYLMILGIYKFNSSIHEFVSADHT